MQLVINGEAAAVPDDLTVFGLLEHLKLADVPVAVEVNREIVPLAEHRTRALHEGDELELVHFVGGG